MPRSLARSRRLPPTPRQPHPPQYAPPPHPSLRHTAQKDESYFCCKWTHEEGTRAPLLLVAGQKGLVRVLDCTTQELVHVSGGPPAMACTRWPWGRG